MRAHALNRSSSDRAAAFGEGEPIAKRARARGLFCELATAQPEPSAAPKPTPSKEQAARRRSRRKQAARRRSRSPRRSKSAQLSPSCLDVGTVEETDAEHLQRHTGLARRSCPRCLYLVRRSEMERQATSRGGITWLTQRPSFLGGSWALGCCVCAAARKSEVIVQARRERAARGQHQACARAGCKWARYVVCSSLCPYVGQHSRVVNTATLLQQHAHTKAHLEATQLLDSSENHLRFAEVVQVDTLTAAGEAAFAGLVPQPTDWKNAWAENSSCVSFHKQQTIAQKKGEAPAGSCLMKGDRELCMTSVTQNWKALEFASQEMTGCN